MDATAQDTLTAGKMPENMAKAIINVIATLGTLSRDQTNKFDRYEYASIDDFITFVRKDASASGLFFIPQEAREPEFKQLQTKKGDPLMMWHARFAFTICHESGETYGPVYKTVMVQANGAQAAGSAQSYALKQLMRALFLIPTGDADDPDKLQTAEYTAPQSAPNRLQNEAERIKAALKRADTAKKVRGAWASNGVVIAEIRTASNPAYTFLNDLMNQRLKELEGAEDESQSEQ